MVTAADPPMANPNMSSQITLIGRNFGLHDFTHHFRLLPSSASTVQWFSDSSVAVKVGPGLGGVLSIESSVGGVASNTTVTPCKQLFGYGPTTVTAVHSAESLDTAGGSDINITGSGFGTTPVADFRVYVGSTEGSLTWISDSSCRATVQAGVGRDLPVYLSLNGICLLYTSDAADE